MRSKARTIVTKFDGGTVSCDAGLVCNTAPKGTFAIAFDHSDTQRSGGYFIRTNGEIIKVGGIKLPEIGMLLASIGTAASI